MKQKRVVCGDIQILLCLGMKDDITWRTSGKINNEVNMKQSLTADQGI